MGGADDANGNQGEVISINAYEVAEMCRNADSVVIVPGSGMAVAHSQHPVSKLTIRLEDSGINIRFAIHPVAGPMPGYMNVLLAESSAPYGLVLEMDEITEMADVIIVAAGQETRGE